VLHSSSQNFFTIYTRAWTI